MVHKSAWFVQAVCVLLFTCWSHLKKLYTCSVMCMRQKISKQCHVLRVAARLEQVLQSQQEKGLLMLHLWNLNVVRKLCHILEFKKEHFKTCEGAKQHMYITEKMNKRENYKLLKRNITEAAFQGIVLSN